MVSVLVFLSVFRSITALSLSVLPGALLSAGALLLPTSLLSSADILPAERLYDVGKRCSTDHLYVAAGLDRCAWAILQGIQIDPGNRQSCHRTVWYRLSRYERPMVLRQLILDDTLKGRFLLKPMRKRFGQRRGCCPQRLPSLMHCCPPGVSRFLNANSPFPGGEPNTLTARPVYPAPQRAAVGSESSRVRAPHCG